MDTTRLNEARRYANTAPTPQSSDAWTGSEGKDSKMAGRPFYAGGGRLTRVWLSIELGYEIAYEVTGEDEDIGQEPVTIRVNRILGEDVYSKRETLKQVDVESDADALSQVASLISEVESGSFE